MRDLESNITKTATPVARIVATAPQIASNLRRYLSSSSDLQSVATGTYCAIVTIHIHIATSHIRPADALRAALKAAGFHARRVSVRCSHSTLQVTIRDASASLTQVKAIADGFEVVRRDHATGEILCGGNTFVRVEYADALVDPVKATVLTVLDPAPNDEYVALQGAMAR